ncbi:MAG: trimeric intracellular cation channel family protein [Kiritimatiellia bacterium]|nr:trimeric intracellular cation channel family protein [Kiritimatiellia bacterium]
MYLLFQLAVFTCGVTGALAAGRKNMDGIGVIVLSIVTALGGGTIRDVLLQNYPVFWIEDPSYLVVAVMGSLIAAVTARFWIRIESALTIVDALGLAMFTTVGAQEAIRLGAPGSVVILMGVITGTAGGVLRDVLSNQVSFLFNHGELYATASILGATLLVIFDRLHFHRETGWLLATGACLALRLAAIRWGWKLPMLRIPK